MNLLHLFTSEQRCLLCAHQQLLNKNDMALRRDIAPGQNHIALRKWGKTFYSPQLFHLAPTADRIVPLAIRDVLKARTMLEVYGVQGLEEHAKGCVLVNNFPIKTIKVFGRVLSYVFKNYDTNGRTNPNNFYIITIDDCSGDVSHINIKILASCIYELFNENSLVEIVGHVSFFQDYSRQIVGERLGVLSPGPDLAIEIDFWKQILNTRKHLRHPWTYKPVPAPAEQRESGEPKFSKRDYLHRLEKKQLRIADPASQAPQAFSVLDSFSREVIEVSDSDSTQHETQVDYTPRLHTFTPDHSTQNDSDMDDSPTIPFEEASIIVLD